MDISPAHSPQVAEVLVFGRSSLAGVAAALIVLASRGWLTFAERHDGCHAVRVHEPAQPVGGRLSETERWLLDALELWLARRDHQPAWSKWKAALGREAIAGGALTGDQWVALNHWPRLPFIARRAVSSDGAHDVRRLAAWLKSYPTPTDALPQSRTAWDTALSYAVGLRQGSGFLNRVRQVNEYYARHFQGVVMTFYTPAWYAPLRADGQERFAYLTGGLSRLVNDLRWDRMVSR